MIVEGQVHGGLADGIGMALMQVIAFDEDGNCLGGSFMDYLLPTSLECPSWELGETVTPSPHHPIGAKGVGESATVGSPPAVVNAVIDALRPFGVRHADMPLTPANVWMAMQGTPDAHRPRGHVTVRRSSRTSDEPDRADARATACGISGVPFVLARVVLAERPTSAKAGDEAIVLRRRHHRGLRRRHLRRVDRPGAEPGLLDSGEPLLLRITPTRRSPAHAGPQDGTLTVHNPCLSGGTLEIFLEPVVPPPLVQVHGDGPIAARPRPTSAPHSATRSCAGRPRRAAAPALPAVVVASHGRDEERGADRGAGRRRPVRRAGRQPPARRGGAGRARRRRICAGPGAHPGRAGHRRPDAGEIALSILAEIVAPPAPRSRAARLPPSQPPTPLPRRTRCAACRWWRRRVPAPRPRRRPALVLRERLRRLRRRPGRLRHHLDPKARPPTSLPGRPRPYRA